MADDDFDETDDKAKNTSKEPGGEISCGVDCVAAVETKANSNCKHCQTHKQGNQLSAYLMMMIKMMIMIMHNHMEEMMIIIIIMKTIMMMILMMIITCIFLRSVMAQMESRRRAVPINWSAIPPWP